MIENQNSSISFEFFPPNNDEGVEQLKNTISKLCALNPEFISITYGAGGSTQDKTLSLLKRLSPLTASAGHLTCVGKSRDEVLKVAEEYLLIGVKHIVALRGDMPKGGAFEAHPQGFNNAAELISGLRQKFGNEITISSAAYPEKHPESLSRQDDIDNLKRKLDAGTDNFITQFFFDNNIFKNFYDECLSNNINKPIIPGILPIMNYKKTASFAAKCGATIPDKIYKLLAHEADDLQTKMIIAAIVAASQVNALRNMGIEHFHFYTLNRYELTLSLARILGMDADPDRFLRIKEAFASYNL